MKFVIVFIYTATPSYLNKTSDQMQVSYFLFDNVSTYSFHKTKRIHKRNSSVQDIWKYIKLKLHDLKATKYKGRAKIFLRFYKLKTTIFSCCRNGGAIWCGCLRLSINLVNLLAYKRKLQIY